MSNSTRRSFRFSLLDFVIILLFLGVIAGLVLRYDLIGGWITRSRLEERTVSFLAEAVTPQEAALFTDGTVLCADGGLSGVLSTVETDPADMAAEDDEGRLVSYRSTSLLDLTGKLTVKLLDTDDGYFWNGKIFMAAGSRFTLRSAGIEVDVIIMDMGDN